MKKILLMVAAALLMQSCFTATGAGAASGALAGGSLGGAIGGLIGGWRGRDLGTVVGVIAGAATGAAVASAAESRVEQERAEANRRYRDYVSDYRSGSRTYRRNGNDGQVIEGNGYGNNESGYRIDDRSGESNRINSVEKNNHSSQACPLVLRNLRFVDEGANQTINREENCKIIFELANTTNTTLYDVVPYVYEVNGNPHVNLSPSTRIEIVKPGDVVRYTCSLRTDNKVKAGNLTFRISVSYADKDFVTLREFSLPSAK